MSNFTNLTSDPGWASEQRFSSGQPFLLDPANRAYLDGHSDYPAFFTPMSSIGCSRSLLTLIFVVSVIFIAVGLSPLLIPRIVIQYGITATAHITRMYTTLDSYNDVNGYHVVYSFSTSDRSTQYTGDQAVTSSVYPTLQTGGSLAIRYVPLDPYLNGLKDMQPPTFDDEIAYIIPWIMFGALGLLTWIILALVNRSWIRQSRLLARAMPGMQRVRGEVVGCTGRLDSDDDYVIDLIYRYWPSDSASVVMASISKIRNDLKKDSNLPPAGTPLIVCYFDQPVMIPGYGSSNGLQRAFVL